MFSMTEKQKAALASVANAPGAIPIVHFGKLREAGFVTSHKLADVARGYVGAEITSSGTLALG